MSSARCRCGSETAGAFLCANCLDRHARNLGDLPALIGEAITTLTRQDRIVRRIGSRSAEIPLPFNWSASVALEAAYDTLDAWIEEIQPGVQLADSAFARCAFLLGSLDWLAGNALGPQCLDEIDYLARTLYRVIDLPVTRWFAGPCTATAPDVAADGRTAPGAAPPWVTCGEPLYVHPAALRLRCPACGAVYATEERREWLRQQAQDALLPLPVIWAALVTLAGSRPPWSVVKRWPARTGARRLDIRGVSLAGEELFRVGDVLDMVAEWPGHKSRQRQATG